MDTMKIAYIIIGLAVVGIIAIFICIIKLIIFIVKKIANAYTPPIQEPVFDESYYEENHKRMRKRLENAEEYRRKHFKTWE